LTRGKSAPCSLFVSRLCPFLVCCRSRSCLPLSRHSTSFLPAAFFLGLLRVFSLDGRRRSFACCCMLLAPGRSLSFLAFHRRSIGKQGSGRSFATSAIHGLSRSLDAGEQVRLTRAGRAPRPSSRLRTRISYRNNTSAAYPASDVPIPQGRCGAQQTSTSDVGSWKAAPTLRVQLESDLGGGARRNCRGWTPNTGLRRVRVGTRSAPAPEFPRPAPEFLRPAPEFLRPAAEFP
jgi:hypothetical protein